MRIFYSISLIMCLTTLTLLVGCSSTSNKPLGLVDGHLKSCSDKPNCLTTEGQNPSALPLPFKDLPEEAWDRAKAAITEVGGKIHQEDKGYLWATFTSAIFRFVDDLEMRIDEEAKLIHIRSASRVGYFDFGVNKKRYQKIAKRFGNNP